MYIYKTSISLDSDSGCTVLSSVPEPLMGHTTQKLKTVTKSNVQWKYSNEITHSVWIIHPWLHSTFTFWIVAAILERSTERSSNRTCKHLTQCVSICLPSIISYSGCEHVQNPVQQLCLVTSGWWHWCHTTMNHTLTDTRTFVTNCTHTRFSLLIKPRVGLSSSSVHLFVFVGAGHSLPENQRRAGDEEDQQRGVLGKGQGTTLFYYLLFHTCALCFSVSCLWQQEEELRKEEERKKAAEERQRFEEERMELERQEQENREKRYRERERQIEEHRSGLGLELDWFVVEFFKSDLN